MLWIKWFRGPLETQLKEKYPCVSDAKIKNEFLSQTKNNKFPAYRLILSVLLQFSQQLWRIWHQKFRLLNFFLAVRENIFISNYMSRIGNTRDYIMKDVVIFLLDTENGCSRCPTQKEKGQVPHFRKDKYCPVYLLIYSVFGAAEYFG